MTVRAIFRVTFALVPRVIILDNATRKRCRVADFTCIWKGLSQAGCLSTRLLSLRKLVQAGAARTAAGVLARILDHHPGGRQQRQPYASYIGRCFLFFA